MGQSLTILAGGYVFVFLSYPWVWVNAFAISRGFPTQRLDRVTKADWKAVLAMLALWTIAWTFTQIVEALD